MKEFEVIPHAYSEWMTIGNWLISPSKKNILLLLFCIALSPNPTWTGSFTYHGMPAPNPYPYLERYIEGTSVYKN